ncbi:MAG: hypothetical protein ACOX7X_02580 [Methanosarcina flavescens]|jgi:hypothetical protein|uniref:hypothetical protein n=1 Tax=Methanosarcina flavescens TaxID=1715806 RepID=UPI001D05A4F6|nr:hypothetical protein [Methanosarcina flavescens]
MIKGPGGPAVTVRVLNDLRIFICCITDSVNALIRYSIRIIQGYSLNLSAIQCTGVYMFCNSENLLFKGDRDWEENLFNRKAHFL